MQILLTNDDGLETPGLKMLYRALKKLGNVHVISPLSQQSAVSHALTIFTPLFVEKVDNYLDDKRPFYGVKGTPADCVKLALSRILKRPPDLVVSGINAGANVGIDVFYSGTVAAALEGALWDITSFAVSLEKPAQGEPDFTVAAQAALRTIKEIKSDRFPPGSVFNINIPACPLNKMKGISYTRQEIRPSRDEYHTGIDPRGRGYYWIKPAPHIGRKNRPVRVKPVQPTIPSDIDTLRAGYISVTPLKANLTDEQLLEYCRD